MKTIKRQWQARFADWPGSSRRGVVCTGARKRGRGAWLHPSQLPDEVVQFLGLNKGTGSSRNWCNPDYKTVKQMAAEIDQSLKACQINGSLVVDFHVDVPQPPEKLLPVHAAVTALARDCGEDNLGRVYRRMYKGSTCGVSVGFLVQGLPANHPARPVYGKVPQADDPIWIYCDSLYQLPTLREMFAQGMKILGVRITGYVEGWDGELQPRDVVRTRGKKVVLADIWAALVLADQDADEVWMDTHGCEACGTEGELGQRAINPECKVCKGQGMIL